MHNDVSCLLRPTNFPSHHECFTRMHKNAPVCTGCVCSCYVTSSMACAAWHQTLQPWPYVNAICKCIALILTTLCTHTLQGHSLQGCFLCAAYAGRHMQDSYNRPLSPGMHVGAQCGSLTLADVLRTHVRYGSQVFNNGVQCQITCGLRTACKPQQSLPSSFVCSACMQSCCTTQCSESRVHSIFFTSMNAT